MKLQDLPGCIWEDTWSGSHYGGTYPVGPGGGEPLEDMSAERIAKVLHYYEESPEGYADVDFFTVVRLTDGQYAVSEAWADTSGFDCQGDAWWKVGPTYESVMAELSEVNRERVKAEEAP